MVAEIWTFNPSAIPGPRNDFDDVRLALSKLDLKTNGIPTLKDTYTLKIMLASKIKLISCLQTISFTILTLTLKCKFLDHHATMSLSCQYKSLTFQLVLSYPYFLNNDRCKITSTQSENQWYFNSERHIYTQDHVSYKDKTNIMSTNHFIHNFNFDP